MDCVHLKILRYDTMCQIACVRVFLKSNRINHFVCAKVLKEADNLIDVQKNIDRTDVKFEFPSGIKCVTNIKRVIWPE